MTDPTTFQSPIEFIPAKKLKVFVVEEDIYNHESMSMAILHLLMEAGIDGATVFKAVEGFGERRIMHTDKTEISSLNLPLTIEATDLPEKIDAIVDQVAGLLTSGLLEVSRTLMLQRRSNPQSIASSQGEWPC